MAAAESVAFAPPQGRPAFPAGIAAQGLVGRAEGILLRLQSHVIGGLLNLGVLLVRGLERRARERKPHDSVWIWLSSGSTRI